MKFLSLKKLNSIGVIIFIAILMRVSALGTAGFTMYPSVASLKKILRVNPDELSISTVAINYRAGKGYVSHRENQLLRTQTTAYRPAFPIELHILAQNLYTLFTHQAVTLDYDNPYYKWYVLFWQVIHLILFGYCLISLYKLTKQFSKNEYLARIVVLVFALYPSTLLYVGPFFYYENFATYSLIIAVATYLNPKTNQKQNIITTLLLTLACLLRPQILLIALGLIALGVIRLMYVRTAYKLNFIISLSAFLILSHIPILIKNHKLFGAYFLSTQSGTVWLQGHSPLARGGWLHDVLIGSEYYTYISTHIPNLHQLNEYQENQAYKQLALQWLKANPQKELYLILKKTALFFFPDNYNKDLQINILTLIVHLGFFGFLVTKSLQILKGDSIHFIDWVLLCPIILAWAISVLYFFGHRWRLYAEPFMIIFASQFYFQRVLALGIKP